MKKIICRAALMLALCLPVCAFAATEPNAKTIEDTTTYEGDTIKITIDQWCYAFNRTNLRFFVANVYVSDPAQMQTAFAGEQYSKNNAEATSAIAERHDAILAINGDYYNYKDKNGLVIRNGVLYRDAASSRDQLLVMRDGTFVALPRGTYAAGEGQKYIDEGVVQSFTFGPLLVNDGEAVELPEKYIISTKDTIREPRTAIGQAKDGTVIMMVVDGRQMHSFGISIERCGEIMEQYGAYQASMLDGGSSSVMVYRGREITSPTTLSQNEEGRYLPDAFLVK